MDKILDSDDEDLGDLTDSCSHTTSSSTNSSKVSKSSSTKVTKLKNKENNETKTRRKSCIPNLMTGNLKEPPLVTRITRNSIKTQPVSSQTNPKPMWSVTSVSKKTIDTPTTKELSLKLEKIETTVFDFHSGEEENLPLSYVTRSGRKAKKTNPRITKDEDNDDDDDDDYKHVESESESDSEHSDKVESEKNDASSGSDFEV